MRKCIKAAGLAAAAMLWVSSAQAALYDIDISLENLHSIDGLVIQATPGTNVLPSPQQSFFGGTMTFFIGDTGKVLTATVTGATSLAKLYLSNGGLGVNDLGTLSGPENQIDNHPICNSFLVSFCLGNHFAVESVTFTIEDPEITDFVLVLADFNAVQGNDQFCFNVDEPTGTVGCEIDIPGNGNGNVLNFLDVNDNGTGGNPDDDFAEDGLFTVGEMTGSAFKFYARSCDAQFGTNTPCNDDYKIERLVWEIDLLVDDVPEPATLSLFGLGLIGLGAAARRRRAA